MVAAVDCTGEGEPWFQGFTGLGLPGCTDCIVCKCITPPYDESMRAAEVDASRRGKCDVWTNTINNTLPYLTVVMNKTM